MYERGKKKKPLVSSGNWTKISWSSSLQPNTILNKLFRLALSNVNFFLNSVIWKKYKGKELNLGVESPVYLTILKLCAKSEWDGRVWGICKGHSGRHLKVLRESYMFLFIPFKKKVWHFAVETDLCMLHSVECEAETTLILLHERMKLIHMWMGFKYVWWKLILSSLSC